MFINILYCPFGGRGYYSQSYLKGDLASANIFITINAFRTWESMVFTDTSI